MKRNVLITLILLSFLCSAETNDSLLQKAVTKASDEKIVATKIPTRPVTIWVISLKILRYENRSIATIKRVVTQRLHELVKVYNENNINGDNLGGNIHITFTIAPSGKVIKSETISSTFQSKVLSGSIRNKMRRWKYERIKRGNVVVSLELNFH